MKTGSRRYRSHCPINFTQELVGDRWSLLIIRDIFFAGKKYYGEFLGSAEKIATNILADRLEKLERNGIITKTPDAENRSKQRYALTQKGKDLLPMLLEMIVWGAKYDAETAAPEGFIDYLVQHRSAYIKQVLDNLE